ncbi:PaaI family thioesterase [Desulfocurvus sp. DL9XJH121]
MTKLDVRTHHAIDATLCGTPVELAPGHCVVRLETLPCMAADASGLVHGGFVFGLADYAAMLAVNHPNVVLGSAETRFLAPVRAGQTVEARAACDPAEGRKHQVEVEAFCEGKPVFRGHFTCFVTERHVLAPS